MNMYDEADYYVYSRINQLKREIPKIDFYDNSYEHPPDVRY